MIEANDAEFLWVEKYRPKTVRECILPDRIKGQLQAYVEKGRLENLLLSGPAGTGKTTVARALCDELDLDHLFVNASMERGIDTLRTLIQGYASTHSLYGTKKVVILDEADNLTPDTQMGLRGCIEAYSENCTFILTCNFKAKLIDAIHSRMSHYEFRLVNGEKKEMATAFFKRCAEVLKLEGVEYDPAVLGRVVTKYFPDYRRTLGELQSLAGLGRIDESALPMLSDVRNVDALVKSLREKDFTSMRKWVVDNGDVDSARIFRRIYDAASGFLKPESVPQCVVILSRYSYQAAFVADQELNLVACLTEVMVDCEFK